MPILCKLFLDLIVKSITRHYSNLHNCVLDNLRQPEMQFLSEISIPVRRIDSLVLLAGDRIPISDFLHIALAHSGLRSSQFCAFSRTQYVSPAPKIHSSSQNHASPLRFSVEENGLVPIIDCCLSLTNYPTGRNYGISGSRASRKPKKRTQTKNTTTVFSKE